MSARPVKAEVGIPSVTTQKAARKQTVAEYLNNNVNVWMTRGLSEQEAIHKFAKKSRDNGRFPMQWYSSAHGGFSTAEPWMKASDDHRLCNVEQQLGKADSVLSFWQRVLKMRKALNDDLIYGSFRLISPDHPTIFAYVRAGRYLVILNSDDHAATYSILSEVDAAGAVLVEATTEGYPKKLENAVVEVGPWEGGYVSTIIDLRW